MALINSFLKETDTTIIASRANCSDTAPAKDFERVSTWLAPHSDKPFNAKSMFVHLRPIVSWDQSWCR
eukprot:1211996-Amphidinium_carterae.2